MDLKLSLQRILNPPPLILQKYAIKGGPLVIFTQMIEPGTKVCSPLLKSMNQFLIDPEINYYNWHNHKIWQFNPFQQTEEIHLAEHQFNVLVAIEYPKVTFNIQLNVPCRWVRL